MSEETSCLHYTLSNEQQGLFYMHYPTDRIVHTIDLVTHCTMSERSTNRSFNAQSQHGGRINKVFFLERVEWQGTKLRHNGQTTWHLVAKLKSISKLDFADVLYISNYCKIYRNKQGLKRTLFNRTRQCNIQFFYRNIFVK